MRSTFTVTYRTPEGHEMHAGPYESYVDALEAVRRAERLLYVPTSLVRVQDRRS